MFLSFICRCCFDSSSLWICKEETQRPFALFLPDSTSQFTPNWIGSCSTDLLQFTLQLICRLFCHCHVTLVNTLLEHILHYSKATHKPFNWPTCTYLLTLSHLAVKLLQLAFILSFPFAQFNFIHKDIHYINIVTCLDLLPSFRSCSCC